MGWLKHGCVAAGLALLAIGGVQGQGSVPATQFRQPTWTTAATAPAAVDFLPTGTRLLSADERSFLANLGEVRVAVAQPPFGPYENVDEQGRVGGMHPDMLAALAKAFGIRLKPVAFANWAAALKAAREREVDLLMTMGVSAERLQYLEFTLGATPSPQVLFGRRGEALPHPEKLRYAVERGYVTQDFLSRQFPAAPLLVVGDTEAALRAVAAGQADAYLGNMLHVSDTLSRLGLQGLEAVRPMGYGTGMFHFAVRKDWPLLASALNKGIQSMRQSDGAPWLEAMRALPAALQPQPLLPLTETQGAVLSQHGTWRVGAVRGLSLLNDFDAAGRHSGIAAEYSEHIARRLGVALAVVPFDSVAQMLQALRQGQIDVVPFLTRTEQRATEFSFSTPYLEMPYMLVSRVDAPMYWSLDSLRGKRLALAAMHPLREWLARNPRDITLVDAANGNEAMDLVVSGHADAAVEVKLFANLRINADNVATLRAVAAVDELPAQFHLATTLGNSALIGLINAALADISPTDRQHMLRRWVAVDLQPAAPWRRHVPLLVVSALFLLTVAVGTAAWLLRLRREVRARRRTEQFIDDVASTVPGVVFRYTLNADHRILRTYYSPGAPAFFGVAPLPGQTLLQTLGDRVRAEPLKAALDAQRHALETGERFRITVPYQHPDGRERWLHAEAVLARSARGHPAWTGYVVDVSAEHELQLRLAQEAAARNLLLATASHELRAPTNNLSLALQTIDETGLASDQAHAVRLARKAAATLTQLLNDVLDAAKFDAGTPKLRPCSFDLHELLQELAEAWRAATSAKGLSFELQLGPTLPRSLVQDPLRLKQVLTNLLSNATKYTRQGGVVFAARCAGDTLVFSVSDSGVGLSSQEQQQLFTPYITFEADGLALEREGSTGLGLVVSRQIAELMGGTLQLRSEKGQGSCFELLLPWAGHGGGVDADGDGATAPDAPAPFNGTVPEAISAEPKPQQRVVLVCDDDATTRLLLVHMLRQRGYRAQECADGAQALQRWRAGDVAAVITDLDMPGMSGQDLIQAIRASEARAGLPGGAAAHAAGATRTALVVCSGNPVPAEGQHGTHDAYLLKPVHLDTLSATLQRLGVR